MRIKLFEAFSEGSGHAYMYKKVENEINQLKDLGYIVKKEKRDTGIYWKIQEPDGNNFEGIGWHDKEGDTPYFYHNRHSGTIEKPSDAPNGVWNFAGDVKGPGGWYTFTGGDMRKVIANLKAAMERKKNQPAKEAEPASKEPAKHYEMKKSTDDYEHDGDTDNEVASWKKVGCTVKMTGDRADEGDGGEYFKVSADVDEAWVKQACDKLESVIKSARHDYSEVLHPTELEYFVKSADKALAEKFKKRFDELDKIYSN